MFKATFIGILAIVACTIIALIGCTQAPESPEPTVVATPMPTVEPTPEPVLLGGEDRRACGLYWESYEWAVKDERGTPVYAIYGVPDETAYYFTNDAEVGDEFVTVRDGCVLYESSSLLRGDTHRDFDVQQFRLEDDLELFHKGVLVEVQP